MVPLENENDSEMEKQQQTTTKVNSVLSLVKDTLFDKHNYINVMKIPIQIADVLLWYLK